jgi:hypothetical protein
MGDTNGDYRLEIILSRRAVELILENGRKDSDETSPKASVDCDFPQSSQSNTSQRWPWHIDALERFPIMWNHVIEKESLNFKELEHVLMEKVEQLFRDML